MSKNKLKVKVAYDFIMEATPCIIKIGDEKNPQLYLIDNKGNILFMDDDFKSKDSINAPFALMKDALESEDKIILQMFNAEFLEDEINEETLYVIEKELRRKFRSLKSKSIIDDDAVREMNIIFMDMKENFLKEVELEDINKESAVLNNLVKENENKGGAVIGKKETAKENSSPESNKERVAESLEELQKHNTQEQGVLVKEQNDDSKKADEALVKMPSNSDNADNEENDIPF